MYKRALLAKTLAVAAMSASLVGVTAGTANAAASIKYADLTIAQRNCPPNYKNVHISGTAAMSQADAQRFIDRPGSEVELRLKGSDWSDDVQLGPVDPQAFTTTAQGLVFAWSACVPHSTLNEDPAPGDRDELYAEMKLKDFRDGKTSKANSRQVTGNF